MIKITDKSFRYTPSFNTDLRKKFKRMEQERRAKEADVAAEVAAQAARDAANEAEAEQKVVKPFAKARTA